MKLKEARKLGINYCHHANQNFAYISYDNVSEFYLTDKEHKTTVFVVNKNGSLDQYLGTKYAEDFHKELKRRKNIRRQDGKRKIRDMYSRSYESYEEVESVV